MSTGAHVDRNKTGSRKLRSGISLVSTCFEETVLPIAVYCWVFVKKNSKN